MVMKEPFEYELSPRSMGQGTTWVTLTLANRGAASLKDLHVELSSLDDYSIDVLTQGMFVPVLDPAGMEVIRLQMSARLSGSVYVTVDGEREGSHFTGSPQT